MKNLLGKLSNNLKKFFNRSSKKNPNLTNQKQIRERFNKNIMFMVGITIVNLRTIHEYFPNDKLLDAIEVLEQIKKDSEDDNN